MMHTRSTNPFIDEAEDILKKAGLDSEDRHYLLERIATFSAAELSSLLDFISQYPHKIKEICGLMKEGNEPPKEIFKRERQRATIK